MSRFCPLFSGSGGNSCFVGDARSGVLVDAGPSSKTLFAALSQAEIDPFCIRAVAVTHEHRDHIGGLKIFLSKTRVPVIASEKTLSALYEMKILSPQQPVIEIKDEAEAGGLFVKRLPTSHDCEGSSSFTFTLPDGRRAAVCTDLGFISDEIKEGLRGCDIVMIESNHDVNMLKKGPYPYPLKQRIAGERGHLSNAQCASALPFLVENGTTRIILAHLSRNNNMPALALSAARSALIDAGFHEERDYILYAAPPSGGKVFYL